MGQPRRYAHRPGAIERRLHGFKKFRGVKDSTAELVSVTPSGLRTLSQYYWIEKIDLKKPRK